MRSPLSEEHEASSRSLIERVGAARRSPLRNIGSASFRRVPVAALWVTGLLLLLTWTLLTNAGHLFNDFWVDTWLIAQQADALRQGNVPSFSLHGDVAVFYPVFAFYGGTLFTFAGTIALVVGSAVAAQVIVYILALAAAYGGWLWLARLAGLRSWPAHVPAILFVTAPYVLTNVYVRQDLTEVVAVATIPPLLAATLSILRAAELRAGPAAALAASTVVLGGSHNLTLLWGLTILGLTGVALVIAVPAARRLLTTRGVLRVLAVVVPAMAVNAWYLLPDLAYHSHTMIFDRIDEWKALLRGPHPELRAKDLFALGRPSGFPGSGLTFTLPVLAMAWVLIAAVIVRSQWREPWARTLAILSLATVAVLVAMTHPRLLLSLPDPWLMIQFSYRLETFALFGICGAVIAGLVLLGPSRHRRLTGLLLPIVALSIIGAAGQMHAAPRAPNDVGLDVDRYISIVVGDYAAAGLPQFSRGPSTTGLILTRSQVNQGGLDITGPAAPGELLYSNVMTPPQMIDVQGAHVVGRWAAPPLKPKWKRRWYLVLRIDDETTPGLAHIVIRQARTLPIVGGRIISILGLLGLAANAAVIARAAWRRRRARARARLAT